MIEHKGVSRNAAVTVGFNGEFRATQASPLRGYDDDGDSFCPPRPDDSLKYNLAVVSL